MLNKQARPGFGAKLKVDIYYQTVNGIYQRLRDSFSLRMIANYLNDTGFQTPTGLSWTRHRLDAYLRSQGIVRSPQGVAHA